MNNEEEIITRIKRFVNKEEGAYATGEDIRTLLKLYEDKKEEIEELKKDNINLNDQLQMTKNSVVIGNLDVIDDKKEEIYAIARANYILGQTDERSQWYKKIYKKLEDLTQEERETDGIVMNTKEKKILQELIGKEE